VYENLSIATGNLGRPIEKNGFDPVSFSSLEKNKIFFLLFSKIRNKIQTQTNNKIKIKY